MSLVLPITLGVFAIALVHANWRTYWEQQDRIRRSEQRIALVHASDLDRVGLRYDVPRASGEGDTSYRRRIAEARARTLAV